MSGYETIGLVGIGMELAVVGLVGNETVCLG
jgi:hypothetical protein